MKVYCHNCQKAKPDVRPVGIKTSRGIKGYWLCENCLRTIQIIYTPWLEGEIEEIRFSNRCL